MTQPPEPYNPYGSNDHLPPPAYRQGPGVPSAQVPPVAAQPWTPDQPPAPQHRRPGLNVLAVLSLIFGVLGGVLFSVLFGIIALLQIKRRGDRGKGLAYAGLAVSAVWVVVIALVGALVFLRADAPGRAGTTPSPASAGLESLKVGDCLNMSQFRLNEIVKQVPKVACTQPHDAEIYAIFEVTGGYYPGDAEVTKQAQAGCASRFTASIPAKERPRYEIRYFAPNRDYWSQDHRVRCAAMVINGEVSTPLKR